MSLILHCGASYISREDLAQLPTPQPLGPRHQPYAFHDFIDLIQNTLSELTTLTVTEEAYGITPDHSRFFGLMQLKSTSSDYAAVVGLRGSHDCSLGRGMALGSKVMVCDNLAFSGDYTFNTKQTLRMADRLPALVATAVAQLPAQIEHQDAAFERFKARALTPLQADALITEVLRRDIVPSTRAAQLIREWDTPSHPEHAEHGFTPWRLHNAVTEVLKPAPPADPAQPARASNVPLLQARTMRLFRLLDEATA